MDTSACFQDSLSAQIIVAGGGPAGVCAAIAAAEEGADVLLIERYGFLGGMATAGLVNPFMEYWAGEEQIIKGLFDRILAALDARGGHLFAGIDSVDPFDPEQMKFALEQMCLEVGVRLRYHTMLAGAEADGGVVRAVLGASKSGFERFAADLFIDCTGDADLAARAGAEVMMGREEDGLCQPMTLNFRMAGVDDAQMADYLGVTALYKEAKARGELDNPRENVLFFPTTRSGEHHFNTTRVVKHDATDANALSAAEIEGRRQAAEMVVFLQREAPGFEKAFLSASAAQIGVRESRRIRGDYLLRVEDILAARKFEDGIARGSYPVDIHNPAGTGTVIRTLPPGESYDIPYRCLCPVGFSNLLVAGRPISADHGAHSSLRVMPIAMAIGEAAGVAAAMALPGGADVRAVDAAALRARLVERGASIHNA
jgi:hypothetical protein